LQINDDAAAAALEMEEEEGTIGNRSGQK